MYNVHIVKMVIFSKFFVDIFSLIKIFNLLDSLKFFARVYTIQLLINKNELINELIEYHV